MKQTLYAVGFRFASGREVFYTGRGGDGWLSEDPSQAFTAYTKENATIIGTRMQRYSHQLEGAVAIVYPYE